MHHALPSRLIVALLLLSASGCVRADVHGETRIYSYELWAVCATVLGGIVGVRLGIPVTRYWRKIGVLMMVVGVICVIAVGPSMYQGQVVIAQESFSVRTGIWGFGRVQEVSFDNLRSARLVTEHSKDGDSSQFFCCECTDGSIVKLSLGNKLTKAALPEIIAQVVTRKIPFDDAG